MVVIADETRYLVGDLFVLRGADLFNLARAKLDFVETERSALLRQCPAEMNQRASDVSSAKRTPSRAAGLGPVDAARSL
jgi:hypothetical protein